MLLRKYHVKHKKHKENESEKNDSSEEYINETPIMGFPEESDNEIETVVSGIYKKESIDGILTVALKGRIDAYNYMDIQQEIVKLMSECLHLKAVILDLSEMTYTSSAGLKLFASINTLAFEKNVECKLIGIKNDIYRMFQLTGYVSSLKLEKEQISEER